VTIVETLQSYGKALTADELATLLNVSRKTVFKQAARGILPSFRIGTAVRFCGPSVAKVLAEQ
jgi:excisionase family DNA binding protein